MKFLAICLSPTIQRTATFKYFNAGSVNRSEKYRLDASGKAVNSARVLNQLESGCVTVVCPLGEKNFGQFLELAQRDKLNLCHVETPGWTRECITVLDRTNESTTEIVVGEPVDGMDYSIAETKLMKIISEEIKKSDAVLLAGSRPAYWSEGLSACIASMAMNNNKIFLADYCGDDLNRTLALCTPSIIKINEEEFLKTFDFGRFLPDELLRQAIIAKSAELNNAIIVTRGKNSTFAANKGEFVEFPAEKVHALNTTACGDSFSAGFLYEFAQTENFEEALAKGTWCAARNAERDCPGSVI